MKNIHSLTRSLLLIMASAMLFSSCVPQKKIKYLQLKDKAEQRELYVNTEEFVYRVQAGDNLYIKIISIDQRTSDLFNATDNRQGASSMSSDAGIYLNSYTVSSEGLVDFPLIGEIDVKNLTVEEIKNKLQQELDEYIKESVVIVKMVNFYVTILGEVMRPGEYNIYQDELNIFEAISMAGDMTDFADRDQVMLIRKTRDGSMVTKLDLTKREFLESNYLYLMPNDIIYVEPLPGKQFTFAEFPYSLIFTTISTTLLLINFFNN